MVWVISGVKATYRTLWDVIMGFDETEWFVVDEYVLEWSYLVVEVLAASGYWS